MVFSKIVNEGKQNLGASSNIKYRAKELRKNLTLSEVKLWNYLRKGQMGGHHFRKQHPYGIYILDFFCFKAGLVIEIDGPIHLGKQDYDLERTKYLMSSGLTVLRFKNEEVEKSIEWVLDQIRVNLNLLPLSQHSLE